MKATCCRWRRHRCCGYRHRSCPHHGHHCSCSHGLQRDRWDRLHGPHGHHLARGHPCRRSVFFFPRELLQRRGTTTLGGNTPGETTGDRQRKGNRNRKLSNRSKAAQEPGLKPGTGPRGQTPGHPNQAALLVLRSTAILLRAGSVPHALLAKGRCLPASTRPPLRPGIQLDPPTSPPHQGRRQRHCSVAASSCCC